MALHQFDAGPIVGHATPDSVRIFGSADPEIIPHEIKPNVGVIRYRVQPTAFGAPEQFRLNRIFDSSGVIILNGLSPDTLYEYQAAYSDSVDITGLTEPDWDNIPIRTLKTASPPSAAKSRSILAGSCLYRRRKWADERGDKTFRRILSGIQSGKEIDLALMLGDQIYADSLNFFNAADELEEYFALYRKAFSQPYIKELMGRIRTYMILDDHEIEDNWPEDAKRKDYISKFPAAIQSYLTYQASYSPVFKNTSPDGKFIKGRPRDLWYTFQDGCCNFFMMDTRTERELSENESEREMISEEQMDALLQWLDDGSDRVKIIGSSVPFFPDKKKPGEDKWSGFRLQRSKIIDYIAQKEIKKVVFLGGDVHISCTSQLLLDGNPGFQVISVISSALFWPWGFQTKPRKYNLNGPFEQGSAYRVQTHPKTFVRDDNFTRFTVNLDRIVVEVYSGESGKLLSSQTIEFV